MRRPSLIEIVLSLAAGAVAGLVAPVLIWAFS